MTSDTDAKGGRACLPLMLPNSSTAPSTAAPKLTVATAVTDVTDFSPTIRRTGLSAVSLADGNTTAPERIAQDRNGYWFPMLLFGFLILLAPFVYQPSGSIGTADVWNPAVTASTHIPGIAFAPLQTFATGDSTSGDPMSVALYWFCVAMFGPMISLFWYHRRARQRGVPPQTGWHLLYACSTLALYVVLFPVIEFIALNTRTNAARPGNMDFVYFLTVGAFLLGLTIAGIAARPARTGRQLPPRRWTVAAIGVLLSVVAAALIEFTAYVQPRNGYGALLIIAVGLLALSLVERGRVCLTVAIAFTGAALLANLVGLRSLLHWLGFQVQGHWTSVETAFGNLLLPAAVLLAGGVIGLAKVAAARVTARHRIAANQLTAT